jgi:hypothetical protein
MFRENGNLMIINPGSIGLPFYKDEVGSYKYPACAEYAMVTASINDFRVEFRRNRYSLRALKDAVRESGMPDPDWWTKDWLQ